MRARIARWGNSLKIRLSAAAAEKLSLQAGIPVDVHVKDDSIGMRAPRPHYRLAGLLEQITPESAPAAVEFAPVGKEAL